MTDIEVDDRFQVSFDETNDIGTVSGREQFEQHIASMVTSYFFQYIGDRNNSNVVQKLRMEARRVVEDSEYISAVENIEVTNQENDSLRMTIQYNTNEDFEFEVI